MNREEKILEAIGYIDLINEQYFTHKKLKLGRYSEEWGKWSREMNIKLRKKEKENVLLSQVFGYWVIRSRQLDLHKRFPFTKRSMKKKLEKEAFALFSDIKERNALDLLNQVSIEDFLKKEFKNGTH